MSENPYDQYPHQHLWRPVVPSPYATHQDLAPLHTKVGALEKGQESMLNALAGYRAEWLTRLDRLEALIQKSPEPEKGNVNLTMRELVIICGALVLAGAFLGRIAPQLLSGG